MRKGTAEAVSLGNCYPPPSQVCKIREYPGTIVRPRASYPEVRKRKGGNDNQAAVRPVTGRWGPYEGLGMKRKG